MLAKTKKIIKRVAFFGDGAAGKRSKHFRLAFMTAKLLAENGYIIVNGGGPGIMLAATLGAKAGGGKVEVVSLDERKEPENYEGACRKNIEMADTMIITQNYPERLNKLVEIADAFAIFKGGAGTLSEVGLTWEMAKFDYGRHEPLIFVGRCWKNIVRDLIRDLQLEKMEQRVVEVVEKPEQVLATIKRVSARVRFVSRLEAGTKTKAVAGS